MTDQSKLPNIAGDGKTATATIRDAVRSEISTVVLPLQQAIDEQKLKIVELQKLIEQQTELIKSLNFSGNDVSIATSHQTLPYKVVPKGMSINDIFLGNNESVASGTAMDFATTSTTADIYSSVVSDGAVAQFGVNPVMSLNN